jgi:hypothetical protein
MQRVRALFSGKGFSLNMEGRPKMQIVIPFAGYTAAMEFSNEEFRQISSLLGHIFFGLHGDKLLEGDWQYGPQDHMAKLFPAASDGGIVCQPSALGAELFLWAFGHGDQASDFIFSPGFSPVVNGLPTLIEGACATKA